MEAWGAGRCRSMAQMNESSERIMGNPSQTYVMSCPFRALSFVFMAPWTVAKQVPMPMAIIQ